LVDVGIDPDKLPPNRYAKVRAEIARLRAAIAKIEKEEGSVSTRRRRSRRYSDSESESDLDRSGGYHQRRHQRQTRQQDYWSYTLPPQQPLPVEPEERAFARHEVESAVAWSDLALMNRKDDYDFQDEWARRNQLDRAYKVHAPVAFDDPSTYARRQALNDLRIAQRDTVIYDKATEDVINACIANHEAEALARHEEVQERKRAIQESQKETRAIFEMQVGWLWD
jgi:hypothetical protein